MSLATEHWEWDAFWNSRRAGRHPALLGYLARGEPHVDEHQARREVVVRPGYCVAWTASEGHCQEPTEARWCAKHAEDFEPIAARRTRLTPEDIAYVNTLPESERAKAKNRLSMKRARQDVAQNTKMKERRRAMRAAGIWSS